MTALAAPQGPLLELEGIHKQFRPRRSLRQVVRGERSKTLDVIRGVSLRVGAGEFYGLLGVNGAGKTTLMKMITTLLIPDAGWARVAGHDVVREPRAVRDLVSISLASERGLFWRLSARQNLHIFGTLNRLPESSLGRQVETVLSVVGLTDAAERRVGEFSSGMIQRLFVARALLASPRLLLLDEPTRSLDPISARTFRAFLRSELSERRQSGVVLATHDAHEAFDLCDRVGILHHGRLLAEGPARELAARFVEPRVLVRTRQPEHQAWGELARTPRVRRVEPIRVVEGGWSEVPLVLGSDPEAAPRLLQHLVSAGVDVGEFTLERASLADLLERVTAGPA